ncbi:MAG: hypothetical protein HYU77_06395 [Betaproteobacteria bacterium]|nr:hypothetical protein [Betaproteobacteria bacterium]
MIDARGFARLLIVPGLLCSFQAPAQMAIPGEFRVSETGAATYTIPIRVPPGTAGMEPKLSLSYNSQAGNGLLGVGWSLSGLSAITRCPRTVAQDGVRGGVNYDPDDRFCLDGQRLVAITGAYGADGTEYRAERDSFAKVVSYGTAGNGPAWFKVWTKSGQTMEFGDTPDSRIEAQGRTTVRVWALNRVQDTKGNYFTVTYTEDNPNGQYYPAQIDYTGNAIAGVTPANSVHFIYEARSDILDFYQAGSLIKNTVRLNKIQTNQGTTLVKDYHLSYISSPASQRPQLTSLTECMATGECFPATTFLWQGVTPGSINVPQVWVASYYKDQQITSAYPYYRWTAPPSIYAGSRITVDFDNDGKADIVGLASAACCSQAQSMTRFRGYFSVSTGQSFAAPSYWATPGDSNEALGYAAYLDRQFYWASIDPRIPGDVTGDGKVDVIIFGKDGVYVSVRGDGTFGGAARWTTGFSSDSGWNSLDGLPRLVVDVDGDRRADIAGFGSDGVYVALSTETSFGTVTRWSTEFGLNSGWSGQNATPRRLVDVNGDGLSDVVGFGPSGVNVALNTGSGFAPSTTWLSGYFGSSSSAGNWTDQNTYPRILADVNGDGLPDIVGFGPNGVDISLNTGTGFLPPAQWIAGFGTGAGYVNDNVNPRRVMDVNGDGKGDVVGFAGDGVYVALSTGSGFLPAARWVVDYGTASGWSNSNDYPRELADVDGDGLLDVVGFGTDGVYVSTSALGAFPDLMISVVSGLGASVAVTYKPLTDNTLYVRDNDAVYPQQDFQQALYVVSSYNTSNGISGYYLRSLSYVGAKVDQQGRGFLGFRQVATNDDQTGLKTTTTYRQDFPYVGLPSQLQKTTASGAVLSQTDYTYACKDFDADPDVCTVAAGKRYFPYLAQGVEASWDLNGAVFPTVTTANQFDSYGNATQITVSTSDGYSKSTTNTFTNDTVNWFLGRLTRATVTSTTP